MSSPPSSSFLPFAEPIEVDTEAEDEVDQLDSDSEAEDHALGTSSKKTGSSRETDRPPGQSLLPALRLESIIKADGTEHFHLSQMRILIPSSGGTGSLALSKEGLFILSVATVRRLLPIRLQLV